jgi:hypothetical protein
MKGAGDRQVFSLSRGRPGEAGGGVEIRGVLLDDVDDALLKIVGIQTHDLDGEVAGEGEQGFVGHDVLFLIVSVRLQVKRGQGRAYKVALGLPRMTLRL